MSDDETDSNVPKIISSVDPVKESNVRSILKGSPTQNSKPKKSLRVSNTAADSSNNRPDETKRIQFHIEEKQAPPPQKVEKVEPTSDEETESSASAAIDDVGSKTKLDFLERYSLLDPTKLSATPTTVPRSKDTSKS